MGIYRRICVLRIRGAMAEAARLESGELARAQRDATARADAPIPWTELFAAEQCRVTDACLVADLLASLLADRMQLSAPPATAGLAAVLDAFPAKSAGRREPGTAPPEVADLIEGMLVQERAESRLRSNRRAS